MKYYLIIEQGDYDIDSNFLFLVKSEDEAKKIVELHGSYKEKTDDNNHKLRDIDNKWVEENPPPVTHNKSHSSDVTKLNRINWLLEQGFKGDQKDSLRKEKEKLLHAIANYKNWLDERNKHNLQIKQSLPTPKESLVLEKFMDLKSVYKDIYYEEIEVKSIEVI